MNAITQPNTAITQTKEITQPKRSSRITKLKKNKMIGLYNKLAILIAKVHVSTIMKIRVNCIIDTFTIIIQEYEMFKNAASDITFNKLLNVLFWKGLDVRTQIRILLASGHKLKTLNIRFMQLFNKMHKKIMKYYREKLDAITTKVWLNDDVVHLIYSYM